MSLEVVETEGSIDFRDNGKVFARLVTDDPFKPYIHPLRTPGGHMVSLAMASDHRHHKGLMYALRGEDLNFWEESPGESNCGVQRIEGIQFHRAGDGSSVGVDLDLLWCHESGDRPTYRERRTLTVRRAADGSAYEWDWSTERVALRDHRLIQSTFTLEAADGRRINYHGLGIRLPRAWSHPKPYARGLLLEGEPVEQALAVGAHPREITCWGLMDGFWTPPKASVTLRQSPEQGFALFALLDPFGYLSLGPTNESGMDVREGDRFQESYQVLVADL